MCAIAKSRKSFLSNRSIAKFIEYRLLSMVSENRKRPIAQILSTETIDVAVIPHRSRA
jgi:hypothetical protein